jgi:hypothetical protein
MMPFEYIALLASIVIALGLTRILTGVGKLLQLRGEIRSYWVHIVWCVNVLPMLYILAFITVNLRLLV